MEKARTRRKFEAVFKVEAVRLMHERRARGALTVEDREAISRGLAAGESIRGMAQALQRAPSTISREIMRNAGSNHYRAVGSCSDMPNS